MLLIGSRALCHHFPEFRKPVDWDVVGTRADAARLERELEKMPDRDNSFKRHFLYDERIVELALIEESPYWAHIYETFAGCESITDPQLGELIIPPASYLMLTKQCGLIYRIAHWHKNLEDLYILRNWIPRIEDEVAALLPLAAQNSRDMFLERHLAVALEPWACHPKMPHQPESPLHQQLHAAIAQGKQPMCQRDGAWQAFPQLGGAERSEAMCELFAEEVMTLGGHFYLAQAIERDALDAQVLRRQCLRLLITSGLPEAWRYFAVNHYHEISARIEADWTARLCGLQHLRPSEGRPCSDGQAMYLPDLLAPEASD